MSTIEKVIHASVTSALVFGGALTVTGCSAEAGQVGEGVGAASQAIATGNAFYGSDTLKPAVAGVAAALGLAYPGTGSGNGEACLRGSAPCSPNAQLAAPMSRDITGGCSAGSDALKTKRVARDGILALTSTANPETNISTADLALAFCSAPSPPAGSPPCQSPLTINGRTYTKFYLRDNASGTTDTLKALLGCTALCAPDANHIIISGNRPAPCTASDSDTQCIAKLVQANTGASGSDFVLGYAGLSARTIPTPLATELTVNTIPPSNTNIQNGTYPLSRFLFVNYNASMLTRPDATGPSATNATTNEKNFLCQNILGPTTTGCPTPAGPDNRLSFETSLVNLGDFLKCSNTSGPFACATAGRACP